MSENTVYLEDESNDRLLEFTGPDAEERAADWAENGAGTFDRVHPR